MCDEHVVVVVVGVCVDGVQHCVVLLLLLMWDVITCVVIVTLCGVMLLLCVIWCDGVLCVVIMCMCCGCMMHVDIIMVDVWFGGLCNDMVVCVWEHVYGVGVMCGLVGVVGMLVCVSVCVVCCDVMMIM